MVIIFDNKYQWSTYSDYLKEKNDEYKEILNFFKSPKDYEKFVLDQADYAKRLKEINFLTLDEE